MGGARALHNHAIATGALLRLYETGRFPELFTVVDGAVNYIRVAQEASGGWGDAAGADVWLVDALARAEALFEASQGQGARLPSQRRYEARAKSLVEGVELDDGLYRDLQALLA